MQKMKVDIIYYTVRADFEMEFNLNGCCPMRLLQSLAYDKKEYVESLARAVSRSKIIIICGPVYGDDGLISMTAKAIKKPLEIIDNREYGIAQDQNVRIIEGSVPLVTKSGIFGGVIIESGPQTIIVLSENNDVRRNIMQSLIHPYVREVSILEIRRSSEPSVLNHSSSEDSAENSEPEAPATADNAADESVQTEIVFSSESDEADNENQPAPQDDNAAPSDEALKAVADEINELSGKIGEALYANDNTENREDGKKAGESANGGEKGQTVLPGTDISDDDYYLKSEDYEIERGEEYYDESAKDDEYLLKLAPQIDFNIDPAEDDKAQPKGGYSEASAANGQPAKDKSGVDIPMFLFDNATASESINDYANTGADDIPFIAESENGEAADNAKSPNKSLNRSIIIITAVLAVIIVLLAYFLIYVPMKNGISTGEYISSLFSGAVKYTRLL